MKYVRLPAYKQKRVIWAERFGATTPWSVGPIPFGPVERHHVESESDKDSVILLKGMPHSDLRISHLAYHIPVVHHIYHTGFGGYLISKL